MCACPLRGGRYEARLSPKSPLWVGEVVARYEEAPSTVETVPFLTVTVDSLVP